MAALYFGRVFTLNRKERFKIGNDPNIALHHKISLLVSGEPILRILLNLIPDVGSLIDIIFTHKAQDFTQKRVDTFINELSVQVKKRNIKTLQQDDEVIFDLFQSVLEKVVKTKSEEKIKRFSMLTVSCLSGDCTWDETEAALNLINHLSDVHIAILIKAKNDKGKFLVRKLPQEFSVLTDVSTQLFCSDLVARGLLKDEGISHLDCGAMEMLSSTLLNSWFLDKIDGLKRK